MSYILQIDNLSKYFGGLAAVSNCSLKIKEGSITGIIGPNGSGKTTLFNLIAGNLKSSEGKVLFKNENITDVPSHELFSKGLLRTFQIAHEFSNMTVLENLMMVPGNQSGEILLNALLKPKLIKIEEDQIREKAYEVAEFLNLKHLANERAGNLSGGQKKLLELARVIIQKPKLLLLDEPLAGVNPKLSEDILSLINTFVEEGVSVLMVEHNISAVMKVSDHIVVLAEGSVIAEGSSDEIRNNENVVSAYLGRSNE